MHSLLIGYTLVEEYFSFLYVCLNISGEKNQLSFSFNFDYSCWIDWLVCVADEG